MESADPSAKARLMKPPRTTNPSVMALLGLAFVLCILFAVADWVRGGILTVLLEQGYPALTPGGGTVDLRRVEWDTLPQIDIDGDNAAFAFDAVNVGGASKPIWNAYFPVPALGDYDPSCGFGCQRAIVVNGLRCEGGPPGYVVLAKVNCSLHLWRIEDGQDVCFVSLDAQVPKSWYFPLPPPREYRLECPSRLAWVPRLSS